MSTDFFFRKVKPPIWNLFHFASYNSLIVILQRLSVGKKRLTIRSFNRIEKILSYAKYFIFKFAILTVVFTGYQTGGKNDCQTLQNYYCTIVTITNVCCRLSI